jgi:hypothetical protein
MVRPGIAFVLCSVLSFRSAAGAVRVRLPNETRPDGPAVAVSLEAFRQGFRMCSRPGPKGVTSYWELSRTAVAEIDRALLGYLAKGPVNATFAFRPEKYVRQYAGFRRGKEEFVHINAYPSPTLRMAAEDARKVMGIGCDGGDLFWGVEYDVVKRKFRNLEINGALPASN